MASEHGFNLGEMGRAICPGVVLPKELLAKLSVEPTKRIKAAVYFSDEGVALLYEALAARLQRLADDARDGMLDVPVKPLPKGKPKATAGDEDDEL